MCLLVWLVHLYAKLWILDRKKNNNQPTKKTTKKIKTKRRGGIHELANLTYQLIQSNNKVLHNTSFQICFFGHVVSGIITHYLW